MQNDDGNAVISRVSSAFDLCFYQQCYYVMKDIFDCNVHSIKGKENCIIPRKCRKNRLSCELGCEIRLMLVFCALIELR